MRNSIAIVRAFSRYKTTMLLAEKMFCTKIIAVYKLTKFACIGLMGVCVAQVSQMLFGDKPFDGLDWLATALIVACTIVILVFTLWEADETSRKELINDLLALRLSRFGSKS